MNKTIFTIRKTNMNWFLLPTNRTEMDLVAFHNNNKKSFLLLSECHGSSLIFFNLPITVFYKVEFMSLSAGSLVPK